MIKPLLPETFGPLQGVRVISSGVFIAQPFAAGLAAELGAEVIHVERPKVGDGYPATRKAQERRNLLCVSLNLDRSAGRDLFLRLLANSEMWFESSKPGTYQRFGLDDDTVLKANPRLVIVHVSGFGQDGDSAYVGLASYDPIGQAFGGLTAQNGFPDPESPALLQPATLSYLTSSFIMWSSLAALLHARATGQGQAIDIAMYEVAHKILGGTMVEYFRSGQPRSRTGNRAPDEPYAGTLKCADGWIVIAPVDEMGRIEATIGATGAASGDIGTALQAWTASRSCDEAVRSLTAAGVPCSKVMAANDMAEDPHYQSRGMHIQWDDQELGQVRGVGIVPKFSATPGKIWRGAVGVGRDNELVYRQLLGLSEQELAALASEGTI
ncbi:MAG TPA: CoA transferase [Candidatus Binataceae bacterium]|nr:CoA transferase [Candidatus Binataceae bacterium]